MNNRMLMDVDPLSSYEAQYEYPAPNAHYYQPPPHPTPYAYKEAQHQAYPQIEYQQPSVPILPEATENPNSDYIPNADENLPNDETNPTSDVIEEEEDIKPDITQLEKQIKTRKKKNRGRISSYWNKKITDKDFAFYGCSVCNIAYTDLQSLDQHVIIHTNRLTSYDLRLINTRKRKLLKKAMKKRKKDCKIKQEGEFEIKPEDGYIGSEIASEFKEDKGDVKEKKENNENNPVIKNKVTNKKKNVHVYKCFGCNKQFALSYYLRIHVRSHTGEKPYTCKICHQTFITASKLGRHTKRIHLAVRHQCRICFKICSRFELLVRHFDSKHSDDKLEGEPYDYNAILPYLQELEEQLKEEKDNKPKTEDPWALSPAPEAADQVALVEVAKEETFVTKQEDKVELPSNIEFFDESKEMEVLPDSVCIKEVKVDFEIKMEVGDVDHDQVNDQGRDDHGFQDDKPDSVKDEDPGSDEEYVPAETWVRPHPPRPPHSPPAKKRRKRDQSIKCTICRKTFTKKNNLKMHMRSHSGDKPFPCTECDRTYSSVQTLKRHAATHEKNKQEVKSEIELKKEKEEPEIVNTEIDTEALSETDNANDGDSDSDYFPEETWARPPSPPPPPAPAAEPPRRGSTTCEICHKVLCSNTYLAVHLRTHTGERPFSCYICNRGFITASKMHRHVLTHDESWEGKDKIKPEDDSKVKLEKDTEEDGNKEENHDNELVDKAKAKLFLKRSKKTFFEQKGKKNKKWTHVCEFCNQKFLHPETLQVHRKCHDKNENMKCYYCLEAYTDQEALKTHEASHSGPKPYLCTLCGHQYTKRGPMIYHRKKCKGQDEPGDNKKFMCEFCNKSYNAHSKLQRHLASHSVTQYSFRYECPVCAHMFHTRYHVRMHLRYHIKEGTILEENRNAVLAMVLQNARKIPKTNGSGAPVPEAAASAAPLPESGGDERSRICNICGQIFQHFYYLEEHLKTHGSALSLDFDDDEEEKKHTCQVCSKSFKLPYYLKLHSFTHTKEKPFICQQCGKGFITKGKLKRHLETHQGLKKYQCHICYKFFTRPSYLRIHVRTIHGTQDYNCRDYGFGMPIGLAHD